MQARITLGVATALIALTVSFMAFAGAPGAVATQGDSVLAGQVNTETAPTILHNTTGSAACTSWGDTDGVVGCGTRGVRGRGTVYGVGGYGSTYGVYGNGSSYGVYGSGSFTGVYGSGSYGLYGTGRTAVRAEGTKWGVYVSSQSIGVRSAALDIGVDASGPTGVHGAGSTYGVIAESSGGVALKVVGRSAFDTAGTAVIPSGNKKVTVSMDDVTPTDFVLATVQGAGVFHVKNATAGTGEFTITINQAPTSPATVTVAYFVISAS